MKQLLLQFSDILCLREILSMILIYLKMQNGARNSTRFLFGMISYVPSFKVRVFTNDYKFWIGVNEYY